jgi:hypothetical protein
MAITFRPRSDRMTVRRVYEPDPLDLDQLASLLKQLISGFPNGDRNGSRKSELAAVNSKIRIDVKLRLR